MGEPFQQRVPEPVQVVDILDFRHAGALRLVVVEPILKGQDVVVLPVTGQMELLDFRGHQLNDLVGNGIVVQGNQQVVQRRVRPGQGFGPLLHAAADPFRLHPYHTVHMALAEKPDDVLIPVRVVLLVDLPYPHVGPFGGLA